MTATGETAPEIRLSPCLAEAQAEHAEMLEQIFAGVDEAEYGGSA